MKRLVARLHPAAIFPYRWLLVGLGVPVVAYGGYYLFYEAVWGSGPGIAETFLTQPILLSFGFPVDATWFIEHLLAVLTLLALLYGACGIKAGDGSPRPRTQHKWLTISVAAMASRCVVNRLAPMLDWFDLYPSLVWPEGQGMLGGTLRKFRRLNVFPPYLSFLVSFYTFWYMLWRILRERELYSARLMAIGILWPVAVLTSVVGNITYWVLYYSRWDSVHHVSTLWESRIGSYSGCLFGVMTLYWLYAASLIMIFRWPAHVAAAPTCSVCGYNLTGNTSGVCPECNAKVANRVRQ
ncbi:MAG: hypothetical protein IT440_12980 [Phycisphaeraceae bacterium]|nr:hypothetical protein [Phycisphaeraceae bacterium]